MCVVFVGFFSHLFFKLNFKSLGNTSRKNSYTSFFFLLNLSGCHGEAQEGINYAVNYLSS